MGIDVYLRWDGMTQADEKAQITGYSIDAGRFGYLREAYHGEPYATMTMFPEFWSAKKWPEERKFKNSILMKRLPLCLDQIRTRYFGNSKATDMALRSFRDFVELHRKLEAEGKNPRVVISA